MRNFCLILLISVCISGMATAQKYKRKSYPVPAKTPEIQLLLDARLPWTPLFGKTRAMLPLCTDNSCLLYFPQIIDQQGGSCAQASGIGYMFSYEVNRLLERDASKSNSNTFSYLFTWNFLNGGVDEGGFVEQGLNIAQKYGVMTNADFGYSSTYAFKWASGYEKYLNALRYKVDKIYTFNSTTKQGIELIKRYLYDKGTGAASGGIVTFSTLSRNWKIIGYSGPSLTNYHSILTSLATDGAHSLTIVGYDDTVEFTDKTGQIHHGAFIVVNSWGNYSHDHGRFYLPYYFFTHRENITEIQLSSTMTGIDVKLYQPKLVFKVGLSYSSRDDLAMAYGASDNRLAEVPDVRYNSVIMSNQGGDYPMGGAYEKETSFELALDYTSHLSDAEHQYARYFLNVIRSQRGKVKGEGKVDYFSVTDYRGQEPKEYICRRPGTDLKWGSNWFVVPTVPRYIVSASPYAWRDKDDKVSGKTYIIRTANGKYAKLRFMNYNAQTGKFNMQYSLQSSGSEILTGQ